jgi:hypothetical protein
MKVLGNSAAVLGLAVMLVSGCAMTTDAPKSVRFDRASDKAIVLLGTKVEWYEGYIGVGRGIQTYWQEYDPAALLLVAGGSTFWTDVSDTIWVASDYRRPTMKVMEVEPGAYAMTAASVRENNTAFVPLADGALRVRSTGYLDPRDYIDPVAPVDLRKNYVFSVAAGEVVYIGHFEFVRAQDDSDIIVGVNYSHDDAAARAALKEYPGVTGEMITLDLSQASQRAAR